MLIIKPTYKRLPHEEYCEGYLDNHTHSLKFRIKRFNTDARDDIQKLWIKDTNQVFSGYYDGHYVRLCLHTLLNDGDMYHWCLGVKDGQNEIVEVVNKPTIVILANRQES